MFINKQSRTISKFCWSSSILCEVVKTFYMIQLDVWLFYPRYEDCIKQPHEYVLFTDLLIKRLFIPSHNVTIVCQTIIICIILLCTRAAGIQTAGPWVFKFEIDDAAIELTLIDMYDFFSCPIVLSALLLRGSLLYHSSCRLGLHTIIT